MAFNRTSFAATVALYTGLTCMVSTASFAATPPGHNAGNIMQGTAKRNRMVPMREADAHPWMAPDLSPDQRAELVLQAMTQD